MLERFTEGMTEEKAIEMAMDKSGAKNRTEALAYLRKKVPKEAYFQKKVKKALIEEFPEAYIIKVAQGMYSESGIPDILCILYGHYFGFEIKRPVFGKTSAIQEQAISRIRKAGGTAEVVTYPEEAIKIIKDWLWEN